MVRPDWLIRICLVLSAWRGVELRIRYGIFEDTGDPVNDFIVSYLEYEELEYNQKKGFTADDFTDHLVGYQTQATHARSFGWETSGYGEIPFAALVVNYQNTRWCMGTVVTVEAVVTPCGCVRSMAFRDQKKTDFATFTRKGKDKYYYYAYDVGLDADVIANRVEFIPEHLGKLYYPHVKEVIADKCFEIWDTIPADDEGVLRLDYTKTYRQLFYPAVVKLSGVLEFESPCLWPPLQLSYQIESNVTIGADFLTYFYNNETDEEPTSGTISSYKFIPDEDLDLSKDNYGGGQIKTDYRLVNLDVELCNQILCNSSVAFRKMNNILSLLNQNLDRMLCWCDVPWSDEETVYQNLKNEKTPVYFKSVHGGIVGAPVVHRGKWVAWTVDTVTRNIPKHATRSTFSRGVDDEVISYLEASLPVLKRKNRPKVNDINRANFAIHDFKDFVPDTFLKKDDLELGAWAQIGNPRFIKPKGGTPLSRASSTTSTSFPGLVCVLLFKFFTN